MNWPPIILACICVIAAAALTTTLIRPGQVIRENTSASHQRPLQRPTPRSDRAARVDLATHQILARQAAFRVESSDASDQATTDRLSAAAKERVATLHRDLDLNPTQQQRIFALLVAFSAPAESGLRINGRTLARPEHSLEDAILEELDSERARIYQELLMDDTAWWQNAIVQLEEGVNLPTEETPDGAYADD